MVIRLFPRAPDYGAGLPQVSTNANDLGDQPDIYVESPVWVPITPKSGSKPPVQIVDGVRRGELNALHDGSDGTPVVGLFGSLAVGAVRCDGRARVLDEIRVDRRYLYAGTETVDDISVRSGQASLRFAATPSSRAGITADSLLGSLTRLMLEEEGRFASELSRDESFLTVVDGPLRNVRFPGRRVVGYVKSIDQWYLARRELDLLETLSPLERTPVFRIPPASAVNGNSSVGRYSWFLRLRHLGEVFHPLAGIVRIEAPGEIPISDAIELANETALALPDLSSTPRQDPRAPNNLVPVGALEKTLKRRLGHPLWIQRLLTASLGRSALEAAYA